MARPFVNNKSPALTKALLARALEHQIDIESELAIKIVEDFFEEIVHCLEKEQSIKLVGLGEFSTVTKKNRIGRNPKTGEEIPILQRRGVKFKVSPTLRKFLNQLS